MFHQNVELILYTRDVDTVDAAGLTFQLNTVHFLPVEPLDPVYGGGRVTQSFGGRLTSPPEPHERLVWQIEGLRVVGINKRQVIVTTRN